MPLEVWIIQYLNEKLSDMVKMRQKDLVVEAILASVRTSSKVPIYYIKGVLMIFNRTPL